MAKNILPKEGDRHVPHLDRSTDLRERRTLPVQNSRESTEKPQPTAAESQLLAFFSPEELALLTPDERRILAHIGNDLPELSEEEQLSGEQRYRKRLLTGLFVMDDLVSRGRS